MIGNKVWILGGPGSGKSTLSDQIALKYRHKKVQLDTLVWGAGWQKASDKQIYEKTAQEVDQVDKWVVDGKYPPITDLVLSKCDTVIFLDPSFPIMFARVVKRSIDNILTRRELWNGNRENIRRFFSFHSMPVYLSRIYRSDRLDNLALLAQARKIGIPVVEHLKTSRPWDTLFSTSRKHGGNE